MGSNLAAHRAHMFDTSDSAGIYTPSVVHVPDSSGHKLRGAKDRSDITLVCSPHQ